MLGHTPSSTLALGPWASVGGSPGPGEQRENGAAHLPARGLQVAGVWGADSSLEGVPVGVLRSHCQEGIPVQQAGGARPVHVG